MHLKRLKVRDFKSFAGKVEIPFEPGYTGIAGPNGMGKSNISDAILFVLGPKSSKALRADRLTHLLFNGGASKKPATECEVSLVFSNEDRLLPVDANEVEITRYVKLAPSDPDGYYSYFYVNGKRTTQTEIELVLAHAGLSGEGYNLVQQGDVNNVVTMGAVPRRGLVERLAGISQFDDELGRAQAKRTDLEANLSRIRTLLAEIKSRLSALETQRLQAIQYRQFEEEKRKDEARLARAGHLMARQERDTCKEQVGKMTAEIGRLETEHTQLQAQCADVGRQIEALDRQIAEAGGDAARRLKAESDAKRVAFTRCQTELEHLEEQIGPLEAQIAELTHQIETGEKEQGGLAHRRGQTEGDLRAANEKAEQLASATQEVTGSGDKPATKLAGAKRRVLELQRRQQELEAGWQKAVESRSQAKAKAETAERELALSESARREHEVQVRDLELRVKEAAGAGAAGPSTAELQGELFQLKNREKSLTAEESRLSGEVTELDRRYLTVEARLKARSENPSRANALTAVDFLLSQRNLGKIKGIRGSVADFAAFDPKHRLALEVAGGSRFHSIVVETDAVAEECIRLLKAEKRGRATFLPLNKMLPSRPKGKSVIVAQAPGALGFAIDLVKYDAALGPAFAYVFGETVVMDDLAHARAQMGGVRLVTLAGELIESTGAISGGYLDPNGRPNDLAAELKRLAEELRPKREALEAAQAELTKLAGRLKEVSEELSRRSIRADANESARRVLEQERQTAQRGLKEAAEAIRRATAQRESAQDELSRLEALATKLEEDLAGVKSEIQQAQESYLGQLPEAAATRLRQIQQEVQAANDARVRLNGELQSLKTNVEALGRRLEEQRTELATAQRELAARRKEIGRKEKELAESKAALESLKAVEEKQSAASQAQIAQRSKLETSRLSLTEGLTRAGTTLTSRRSSLQSEEVRLAQAEQHLKEVEAALADLPAVEADEPAVPVEELKRRVATLAAQITALGDVNLRAIDEYDQEKTRSDEFETEAKRLDTEKEELVRLVAEIERKKCEKITEVVARVHSAYVEIYRELTRGGEGEICLEDPKNPLAGGLIIKARPVGKNVQRLEQLSGGEKSIASLAFIFALQRYEPSPLYVFDEVDMSLDGINAEYVGHMLRHDSERAQFLVISLRKVTLKFARQLYGVTQRGDGRSRVYGITLDDIQDVDDRDTLHGPSAAIGPAASAPAPTLAAPEVRG